MEKERQYFSNADCYVIPRSIKVKDSKLGNDQPRLIKRSSCLQR